MSTLEPGDDLSLDLMGGACDQPDDLEEQPDDPRVVEWPLKVEEGLVPHEVQLLRRLTYSHGGGGSWPHGGGS